MTPIGVIPSGAFGIYRRLGTRWGRGLSPLITQRAWKVDKPSRAEGQPPPPGPRGYVWHTLRGVWLWPARWAMRDARGA
jgi:hypothetical protein